MIKRRGFYKTYKKVISKVSKTKLLKYIIPAYVRTSIGNLLNKLINAVAVIDDSVPYQVLGHNLWVYPGSYTSLEMISGTYEPDTVLAFQELIRPNMIVVDIGAFIGFYSLIAARYVGMGGKVYAFEPNPLAFKLLHMNIMENGYEKIIEARQLGISNKKGRAILFIDHKEPAESNLFRPVKMRRLEISTCSLDDLFDDLRVNKVDFIKVDVEGAEIFVLEGMRNIINNNDRINLIVEFNPYNQKAAVGSEVRLLLYLEKLSFKRYFILKNGFRPILINRDISFILESTKNTGYVNILCMK